MGSNVNLWKAVKVAKNLNMESIPTNLTLGGCPLRKADQPGALAAISHRK